jgi:hypothetical protein
VWQYSVPTYSICSSSCLAQQKAVQKQSKDFTCAVQQRLSAWR